MKLEKIFIVLNINRRMFNQSKFGKNFIHPRLWGNLRFPCLRLDHIALDIRLAITCSNSGLVDFRYLQTVICNHTP